MLPHHLWNYNFCSANVTITPGEDGYILVWRLNFDHSGLGEPAKKYQLVTECSLLMVLLSYFMAHWNPVTMLKCASKKDTKFRLLGFEYKIH